MASVPKLPGQIKDTDTATTADTDTIIIYADIVTQKKICNI